MARVADDADPLRTILLAARGWSGPSPSRFMGRRRVTTFEYDDAGHMVRATEEPEWTDDDRAQAYALLLYERGICSGCGCPLGESTDPANEGRYQSAARACFGCVEMDIAGKRFEGHDHPSALRLSVTLPPAADPEPI